MNSNLNKHKEPQFVTKKNIFRQQIRRQYLDDYMSKKRTEHFGWSHQEYLNTQNNQPKFSNQQVEIDKYHPLVLQKPYSHDLKPHYNENYFNQMNLLNKMIGTNKSIDLNQNQSQQQYNFKYKNLYSFLLDVIRQSLDQKYFEKFQDNQLFIEHFKALKQKIYQQLGQEIENFLIGFHSIDNNILEENQSQCQQDLYQTYRKLLYQLENFIECYNLQAQQLKQWPLISVQEQLIFLLKIFIEITYYDKPTKTQNILDVINRSEGQKIHDKYRQVFDSESSDEQQPSRSVTEYLINEGGILQRLKFLIVFGHSEPHIEQQSNNFYFEKRLREAEKKRKYREIKYVLHLLSNIAFNVGSDILFQTGIISQLRCLLKEPFEPFYTVNISQKFRGHLIPKIHQQIIAFILNVFQMVRNQEGLDYLSEMNSLFFVFESLVDVTMAKKQIEKALQCSKERTLVENQFLLVECNNTNLENDVQGNEDSEDVREDKHSSSNSEINTLNRVAEKCIESIEFHLILGENLLRKDSHYNQKLSNRYLLKLKYLIRTEQEVDIFVSYRSGQELLKRWKITQD